MSTIWWVFSKCWLFFFFFFSQFSALCTVLGCLPFITNTCHLTSLTRGTQNNKNDERFFGLMFLYFRNLSFPYLSLSFPLLYPLALYPPHLSFPLIHSLFPPSSFPFLFVWFPRTDEHVAGILIPNDFKYFLYFPLSFLPNSFSDFLGSFMYSSLLLQANLMQLNLHISETDILKRTSIRIRAGSKMASFSQFMNGLFMQLVREGFLSQKRRTIQLFHDNEYHGYIRYEWSRRQRAHPSGIFFF